jgi:exodeoxyribonuclease VII large subunit
VGHEVDVTIADFVADLRAPTPSAAAEIVIAKREDFCASIERLRERAHALVEQQAGRRRTRLVSLERRPGLGGWPARLALTGRHVAELSHQLRQVVHRLAVSRLRRCQTARLQLETLDPGRRLGRIRGRLAQSDSRLAAAATGRYHRRQRQLASLAGQLEGLSPLAVLGRGYAVCWTADRSRVVRDASRVGPGDQVLVTLDRGELDCRVERAIDDERPGDRRHAREG